MRSCYRLILVLAVVVGLPILVTGCESEEIEAARLDAETKWAAAHEARAAIPTLGRIEEAQHAVTLAQQKWQQAANTHAAARTAAEAAADRAEAEARRLNRPNPWIEVYDNDPDRIAAKKRSELLFDEWKLTEQELKAAERERELAIALAQQLTAVAEEATDFLEAGKRAQR